MSHEQRPTPIADVLMRIGFWPLMTIFAVAGSAAAIGVYLFGGPLWVGAMGYVAMLFFGGIVVLRTAWVLFKRWRYPTYYGGLSETDE